MATRDSVAPATPLIGRIDPFDAGVESITAYLERLQLYFDVNSIPEPKRVSSLLTLIGPVNYNLLRSLVAPTPPREKSYDELLSTLENHYNPKKLVIAERYHFYQRNQKTTESISEYIAELRQLAIHCEFQNFLDEALRDKLVCGLKSEAILKRLLTEKALTLEKALEISQSMEAAERDAKGLNKGGTRPHAEGDLHNLSKEKCFRCGKQGHAGSDCKFKEYKCRQCGKTGHLAAVCRTKRSPKSPKSRKSSGRGIKHCEPDQPDTQTSQELGLFAIGSQVERPIKVELTIDEKPVVMEVDTGAAVSVVSEDVFKRTFPGAELRPSKLVLRTYTGESMPVLGELAVQVKYGSLAPKKLDLAVVKGSGTWLLGRNWLHHIRLDWKTICSFTNSSLDSLLDKYSDVYAEGLGTVKPFKVKLNVSSKAKPKFCKPRPVPFALRSAVEADLDRLEREGVIEKVTFSEWATPVVVVPKQDSKVRICGDYKVTINPHLDVDQYPLPRPEDLFATLANGKQFTKLDLKHAYNQLLLEDDACKYVTINTHRGLYQYKRLPFGIASAPALFQMTMDTILQGLDGVICYIDDILVTGATPEEHLKNLEAVLKRLQEHGIRLKLEKCKFMQASVEYLGYRIDAEGLHATDEKLQAITAAPVPRDLQELRSFLGLLNYYG